MELAKQGGVRDLNRVLAASRIDSAGCRREAARACAGKHAISVYGFKRALDPTGDRQIGTLTAADDFRVRQALELLVAGPYLPGRQA